MQTEKWENPIQDNSPDSDGEDWESLDELDEILEIKLNKIGKARLPETSESKDGQYTVVLTQRLHREPTTRTKRAQRMHEAYCRSMGLGNHTPESARYVNVMRENGKRHWTIRR